MLDQVLELFGITPAVDLDLMSPNQALSDLHSAALRGIGSFLRKEKPDVVLVHGDTTTALAASEASFYMNIPLGHVEAGLRSGNTSSPFPEELNRQFITKIANWHFAPTLSNRDNLLAEGVDEETITVTGNTVVDSLRWVRNQIGISHSVADKRVSAFRQRLPFDPEHAKFVLVTGHRRENLGAGFESVVSALRTLAHLLPDFWFIFPVHPNPQVKAPVEKKLSPIRNVLLLHPLGYAEFVFLLMHAEFVISDSGGVQEEAPSFGKHVLVLRENTERPEGVASGFSKLVGTSESKIVTSALELVEKSPGQSPGKERRNPFGDGHAAEKILRVLRNA